MRTPDTPSTLSNKRPPLDLSKWKWERPEALPQRFPDTGSSQSSRTFPSTSREGRTWNPSGEGREGRHKHRQDFMRTAPGGQTKWKRPMPFPMPTGSERSSPRDSPPHRSHSAPLTFPSRSTAARSRRTPEPDLLAEKVRSLPDEQPPDDEGYFESEAPCSDYAREAQKDSRARRLKIAHKEHGSLRRRVFRDDELSSRNRSRDTPVKTHAQNPKPRSNWKPLNKTKVDVFIPSIVSVGNLARILGVSLGAPHFVRQYSRCSLPR